MNGAVRMGVEEEGTLLDEATSRVRAAGFNMKKLLDEKKLDEALRRVVEMLQELKTDKFSPKQYYSLYVEAVTNLNHLEQYIKDPEYRNGRTLRELYETVQYEENVIPRLYLMVIMGVIFMKEQRDSRKEVLHDLVEMCMGVQHPLRGVLLRQFLLSQVKTLLPDVPPSADATCNIDDSIAFILLNFSEMNKLWVRMQHIGHSKDREKRIQERKELQTCIGTNLSKLSQLDNLTLALYKQKVLPELIRQCVMCRDKMAQEFLIQSFLAVFPNDFHMDTLDELLISFADLEDGVDVKKLIQALTDTITQCANEKSDPAERKEAQMRMFNSLADKIPAIIAKHKSLPLDSVMAMQHAQLELAFKCFPDDVSIAKRVIIGIATILAGTAERTAKIANYSQNSSVAIELQRILTVTVHSAVTWPRLVEMCDSVNDVAQFLDFQGRRTFAHNVVKWISGEASDTSAAFDLTKNDASKYGPRPIVDLSSLHAALALTVELVYQPDNPDYALLDGDDIEEDQVALAKIIHMCSSSCLLTSADRKAFVVSSAVRLQMLECLTERLVQYHPSSDSSTINKQRTIDTQQKRLRAVACPLLTAVLTLAEEMGKEADDKCDIALKSAHSTCKSLGQMDTMGEQTVSSLLALVRTTNICANYAIEQKSQELFRQRVFLLSQAVEDTFTSFEETLTDSRKQATALQMIAKTLTEKVTCLTAEEFEPFVAQVRRCSMQLFKKADRVVALPRAARLVWFHRCLPEDFNCTDNGGCPQTSRDEKVFIQIMNSAKDVCKKTLDPALLVQMTTNLFDAALTLRIHIQDDCGRDDVDSSSI